LPDTIEPPEPLALLLAKMNLTPTMLPALSIS
jgi:hypothetical protein